MLQALPTASADVRQIVLEVLFKHGMEAPEVAHDHLDRAKRHHDRAAIALWSAVAAEIDRRILPRPRFCQ